MFYKDTLAYLANLKQLSMKVDSLFYKILLYAEHDGNFLTYALTHFTGTGTTKRGLEKMGLAVSSPYYYANKRKAVTIPDSGVKYMVQMLNREYLCGLLLWANRANKKAEEYFETSPEKEKFITQGTQIVLPLIKIVL